MKEIQHLTKNNLTWDLTSWNVQKKENTENEIVELRKGIRKPENEKLYLHTAHKFLCTHDPEIFLKRVKSVMFPFESVIEKGERLDKFSFNPKDEI